MQPTHSGKAEEKFLVSAALDTKKNNDVAKQQTKTALAKDMSGLQFEPAAEHRFKAWYQRHYLQPNRAYLLAGALVMAILAAFDKIISPDIINQISEIRIPVILLMLTVFAVSHLKYATSHLQTLLCITAFALHSSLLATSIYAWGAGYFHYQGAAIVSIIFICLLLKMQFCYVLPLAILLWFTQVIGMHFLMIQPFAEFLEFFILYTVITILSLVIGYRSEHELRRFFITRMLIPKKAVPPPARSAAVGDKSTATGLDKPEAPQPAVSADSCNNDEGEHKKHTVRSLSRASEQSSNW